MATPIDWKAGVEAAGREIETLVVTLREKGGRRFARAFAAAGLAALGAYFAVYRPPQARSAHLQSQIDHAKMMADYGGRYKDLRDQLNAAYAQLPAAADRDQWLSNSVRASLNADGLVTDEFKPLSEREAEGLIFQSASVSLNLSFQQFYGWLQHVEGARPMMRVLSADLQKKRDDPGRNGATCTIATVIPSRRFR